MFRSIGLIAVLLIYTTFCNGDDTSHSQDSTESNEHSGDRIVVFGFDFTHVRIPFDITFWIIVATLAKIAFHLKKSIPEHIPESCLLILMGCVSAMVMRTLKFDTTFKFTSELFFMYLLPPIILEAGYFVDTRLFFDNIGTILSFAILGTVFNIFTVGLFLICCKSLFQFTLTVPLSLLYASLLAAVDPVAVLAVFDEMKVKEGLYILVFGESILNDAVTVALYHTFEALINYKTIGVYEAFLALASFLTTSIGGTVVGLLFGLLCSILTRFTGHVSVIEPMLIILVPYLGYLTAEMFHFSGIIAIMFAGIVMRPYVELNVCDKSRITIKYFIKTLSSTSDTVIFMFLGASVFTIEWKNDVSFFLLSILSVLLFRAIGIWLVSFISNHSTRLSRITWREQLILVYGGLRGAVSFSLASILHIDEESKRIIVCATIIVVLFTVLIQGSTFRIMLNLLKIKTGEENDKSIFKDMNMRLFSLSQYAIEEIMGVFRPGRVREFILQLDSRYFKPLILRKASRQRAHELVDKNLRLISKGAGMLALTKPELVISTEMISRAQGQSKNDIQSNLSMYSFTQFNSSLSLSNISLNASTSSHDKNRAVLDVGSLRTASVTPITHEDIQRIYQHYIPSTSRYRRPTGVPSNKYTVSGIEEGDAWSQRRQYLPSSRIRPIGNTQNRHHYRSIKDSEHRGYKSPARHVHSHKDSSSSNKPTLSECDKPVLIASENQNLSTNTSSDQGHGRDNSKHQRIHAKERISPLEVSSDASKFESPIDVVLEKTPADAATEKVSSKDASEGQSASTTGDKPKPPEISESCSPVRDPRYNNK